MSYNHQQIAIDGPAASGKSTVAKRVSEALGACYVNTGEMYRTVAWLVHRRGLPHKDHAAIEALLQTVDVSYQPIAEGKLELMLNGEPVDRDLIRAPEVTQIVSQVSAIPAVRHWLVARQRESAERGFIVMEGRDIGTVVLPQARHKFFVTASPLERARRRLSQAGETIDGSTLESVAAEIAERDRIDSTRAMSPLKPAEDAIIVDNSEMTIDETVKAVIAQIQSQKD